MTDFDQLIKEKVNKKEYPYSASSWRRFSQKAGLKSALTLTKAVVIGISSASLIAVAGWCGFHFMSPKAEVAPAVETAVRDLPEPEVAAVVDTACAEPTISSDSPTELPSTNGTKVKPEAKVVAPEKTVVDTTATEKPERKPILRPKNPRRILEIDPDTIKSND